MGIILFNIKVLQLTINSIIMTQEELALQLIAIKEQNDKARQERLDNVARLEQAIIDAGTVSPAVQEALEALRVSVEIDDNIIPDATTEETTTVAPE
jgi:hypothetical protein